jgi:hypothetical protein
VSNDSFKLSGRIKFEVRDKDGNLKDVREITNLVVSAGKAVAAGLLNTAVANAVKYIAIGTGAVAPAPGDTALGSEITTGGGARLLATTLNRVTTTVTNDTAQWVVTFTFSTGFAVTESGLFDQLSLGGNMLARQTFTAINVVNTDSLTVTWRVQCS